MKGRPIRYRSGVFCIAWACDRQVVEPLLQVRCRIVAEYEREHPSASYLALIECPDTLVAELQAIHLRRSLLGDGTYSRAAARHFLTAWLHGRELVAVSQVL
jgi:hypothetical protein